MSESPPVERPCALSMARRIDVVRDEFELAIKDGQQPRIENYLARLEEAGDRRHALEELLLLEFEYRRERGDSPRVEEYVARFPQVAGLVESTIRRRLREETVSQPRIGAPSALPATDDADAVIGDYELIEKIGEGGMGVVYKARQRRLDRIVALKTIRGGQMATAEDVQRFHTEAAAAANLQHPGIVAIHEVGEHKGVHFFSMEFVEGRSLADRLRGGALGAEQAAALVAQVAEAVHFAHERGVLHRDLKPSNILLDQNDRPRVVDFGLAKRVESDSELTRTGQILGTPSYMPPEQAAGCPELVDPRGDVYSLGAVLYELLTGRPPFRGASAWETIRQVVETEPTPLRMLDATVPKDVETICLKCLDKKPERRYATAEALAEDLRRFTRGEPIHARPIGPLLRAVRWCQRKPLIAGLIAAVVLALATGTAVSAWFGIEAHYRAIETRTHEQKELADSLVQLGDVHLNTGRLPQAADCFQRAIEAYAALAADRPAEPEYRKALADSQYRLGDVHFRTGRLPQAADYCGQAIHVYAALAADYPAVDEYRIGLAVSHRRHGTLQWLMGDTSEAVESLGSAIEMVEKLAADHPSVGRYRDVLIEACTELANWEQHRRDFSSAIAAVSKVIELGEQPDAAGTPLPKFSRVSGLNRAWRGDVYALAGRLAEATADYRLAIEAAGHLVEKDRRVDWQDRLAALAHSGKWRVNYYRRQESKQPSGPQEWTDVLTKKPLATADVGGLHFSWKFAAPAQGVPADYFALVAESEMEFDGGEYDLALWADDGARFYADGKLVLDSWKVRTTAARSTAKLRLPAGKHSLRVEFFKATGDARLTLALTPRR